jgi:ribose 5-phosphate isomerase B
VLVKVVIAADHAGLSLKAELVAALGEKKVEFTDLGPMTAESVDYPDFALKVARAVSRGEATLGVLVCGTGIGMSMAANKIRGVRAAVCTTEFEARATRSHNDANVLCLGQRVVGAGLARSILDVFLSTAFEGGRHGQRVKKISDAEEGR